MAGRDEELKLALKLEGLDKIKALKDILGDVNKSIATREQAEKGLVSAIKQTATVEQMIHGEFKKELDLISNVRSARTNAFDAMRSEKAKERDTYFSVGTELRKFYMEQRVGDRTMREGVQTVRMMSEAFGFGGLAGGLAKAMDAFQQTEFAVKSLAIGLEGAGGKFASFGQKLMAFAGPTIAGGTIIVGMGLIAGALKDMEEAAKKAADELGRVNLAAGNIQPERFVARGLREAQKGQKEGPGWLSIFLAQNFGITSKLTEEVITSTKKLTEAEEEYAKVYGVVATAKTYAEQQEAGKLALEDVLENRIARRFAGTQRGVPGRMYGPPSIYGELQGVAPKPYDWGVSQPANISWGELDEKSKVFFSGMQNMIGTLSQEVRQGLGGAFVATFGEANSLMEKLLQSFMIGIGDALLKLGMRKAVSYIPVIGPLLASQINSTPSTGYGLVPGNEATLMSHSSGGGIAGLSAEVATLSQVIRSGRWDVDGSKLRYVLNKDLNSDRMRRVG